MTSGIARERRPIATALALFAAWMTATYLLEGRIGTFLRPGDVEARLWYAVVANLAIGVIGSLWLLGRSVPATELSIERFGFRGRRRTFASVAIGLGAGALLFVLQGPPTLDPVLLLNGFTQVWVVSVAEVLVCWVAVGGVVRARASGPRWVRVALAWVLAAALFAVYHFAHSPPFNTPGMVAMLGGVGLLTGAFYFGVGEVYGTVMFHNFLALTGVTRALAESGRLEGSATVAIPNLLMAIVVTLVLVGLDRAWIRRPRPA